jgi:mRNA interferase RelE/StbE
VTYSVSYSQAAIRQLGKLDRQVAVRVRRRADQLAAEPRPHGCVQLVGSPGLWRVRVGDYRIVYQIRDEILVVLVVDVGHRREIYRRR